MKHTQHGHDLVLVEHGVGWKPGEKLAGLRQHHVTDVASFIPKLGDVFFSALQPSGAVVGGVFAAFAYKILFLTYTSTKLNSLLITFSFSRSILIVPSTTT